MNFYSNITFSAQIQKKIKKWTCKVKNIDNFKGSASNMYIQVKFFFGYFSYTESPWYLPFPSKDLDINIYVIFQKHCHDCRPFERLFVYIFKADPWSTGCSKVPAQYISGIEDRSPNNRLRIWRFRFSVINKDTKKELIM